MSSLVHLGRAAASRSRLAAPREREAVAGTITLWNFAGLAADDGRDDAREGAAPRPTGRG
jgi:hypothetical protein